MQTFLQKIQPLSPKSRDHGESAMKIPPHPDSLQFLLSQAAEARRQAYAPYSEFFVGAALLCSDGSIHRGCNVENASYGLTQCAERVAIANAITAGQRHFVALALSLTKAGTPCGACLQAMQEFAPQLRIILGDETGKWVRETSLPDLLPQPFGFVK